MNTEDVLSQVFSTLHIKSELYFQAHLAGDYAVRIPDQHRHIRFHLVLSGSCWLRVEAADPVELHTGDLALVPNGANQILSADPSYPPTDLAQLLAGGALTGNTLTVGAGRGPTKVLCGFCHFDEGVSHPVLAGLPSLIRLAARDLAAEPWLAATLDLMAREAALNSQGTSAVLNRLAEIAIIQATRRLAGNPSGAGFIAALADPALALALFAIHRAPAQAWTVSALAAESAMSRASFAKKFADVVGVPPLTYVTDWRLMRARALLSGTNLAIADIAGRCGYASLPSFSRRFKQRFAIGPGAYRRHN